MPKAGKTARDATVLDWRVAEGSSVNKGDSIVLVETEEGRFEVEAASEGIIRRVLAAAGKTLPFGQPLAELAAAGEVPGPSPAIPQRKSESMATGIVIPVLMPQAGNSMEEGTILSWKVKPGDRVKVGDVLVEIETDKSTMEVEATDEGRVARIVAEPGAVIPVKQPIAFLADNDADVDAYVGGGDRDSGGGERLGNRELGIGNRESSTESRVSDIGNRESGTGRRDSGVGNAEPGGRIKASPYAKKVAAQRGVDLSAVKSGSGPGGRILSSDVTRTSASASASAPASPSASATRRPMSRMRKAIGKALTASKQTVPHFYVRLTLDADPIFSFYKLEKEKYKVSVNDVLVKACAKALQEFPSFRSRMEDDEIVEYAGSNIGIAVGIEDGLLVPVLMGVERMALPQISNETRRIAEATRTGRVENQGKGVFTISNMGMYGVEEFSAIINPPEAAILAVGAIRESVVVKGGMMRPGRVMTITLSCDHRIVDGALAAKFMARLKELLESPTQFA